MRLSSAYNYPYEKLLKAAGYLKNTEKIPELKLVSPKVNQIIKMVTRAPHLDEDDFDVIAKQVKLLINYAQRKNHWK